MEKFNGNIRAITPLDDADLRAAMKGGWNKELPAITDEHGVVLVGHRRLKIAREEGIKPVIKMVVFGSGPQAEAERVRLANVSNIGGVPLTAEDRKRQAERLYDNGKGLTMEAIGHMLGVTHKTISKDLEGVCTQGTNSPRTSKRGRKGEGRPKGARRPERDKPKDPVRIDTPHWKPFRSKCKQEGTSASTKLAEFIERDLQGPEINREELSMTAQERLDAALRQYKSKLYAGFHDAVNNRVREFLEETILPRHRKEQDEAKRITNARKGVMNKLTFNKIRRALHPDSRNSISDNVLAEAFDTFMRLEKLLLNEKDSPTDFAPLPKTMAEWDKMKAAAKSRRAKASGQSALRPR